ncbi:vezatin-like [Ornithodoros turicata]|uniref:vezatin-like n=1 Tax=Ornithodoros turicata TaxID=34597 RepID=UPI00313987B0
MEDESVDAEVIPPNSPLYQYLSEAGYDPAELYDTHEWISQESVPPKERTDMPMHVCIAATATTLGCNVQYWISKAWNALLNSVYEINSTGFLSAILDSPMLLEDDHRFLENLLSAQSPSSVTNNHRRSTVAIVTSAVLVLMISRWIMAPPWNFLDDILAATACLLISWLLLTHLKKKLVVQHEHSLSVLLALEKDFRSKVKKCLQVIQESEIVARGFTLASHNVPVQRLEMNKLVPSLDPNRQCPELRQSLFHWTREMFLFWRNTTCDLMKSVPLAGELDSSLLYLACTEPEELSKELFSENEEELYVGTDFYSLSALKSMLYLLDVQQSEFLRRLALSMAPNIKKTRQRCAYELKRAVDNSKKVTESYLNKVTNAYQLYKSCHEVRSRASTTSTSRTSLPSPDFHVAVHSLALHLQAALKRVEAMEDITESFDVEQMDEELKSRLKCLLTEVQAEIASAGICVQDVTGYIEKREKFKEEPVENNSHRGLLSTASGDIQPVVTIKEDTKTVIVDEVFEALLTEKPEPSPHDWDDDDDFMIVPKQARARQKEASAVVLKELRTVLVVKAKEHQEREKKALERSGVEGELFDKLGFVLPEAEEENEEKATIDADHPPAQDIMPSSALELISNDSSSDVGHASGNSPAKSATSEPVSCAAQEDTFLSDNEAQERESATVESDSTETMDRGNTVEVPPSPGRFSLPHPTNIAQMAVNKSKFFTPLQVCTFEDAISCSSSEDDENESDN